MHPNASASHSLARQYKPTTFIAPHTVCAFIAQPSTEASTLPINPTVVLYQSASEPMFKDLDDHFYTLDPTVKLRGTPTILTKKPSIPEKSEKMVGKVKSVENDMESFLGLVGKEDVSYKDWGMSSSISLLHRFEISKFEEHDGQKDSVKHLGRYCNQSRETEGKKKGNITIVVPGPKQSLRGPIHQYCQPQSQAYISNPLTHLQQGTSFQNPRSFIPLSQCPWNNAQLFTHPSSYPQWYEPVPKHHPQPPQIYQGTSKSTFHPRPEFAMMRKEKDNFTPIGGSYVCLFQRLRHRGMITPLLGHTLNQRSRNFDPNARCAYHSDA
ncbi:hypothetical protein P3S67_028331 [Capsicum chacoense]